MFVHMLFAFGSPLAMAGLTERHQVVRIQPQLRVRLYLADVMHLNCGCRTWPAVHAQWVFCQHPSPHALPYRIISTTVRAATFPIRLPTVGRTRHELSASRAHTTPLWCD